MLFLAYTNPNPPKKQETIVTQDLNSQVLFRQSVPWGFSRVWIVIEGGKAA